MAVRKRNNKPKKPSKTKKISSRPKKAQTKNNNIADDDRRRHKRRGVLDTFHMFLCLKERGLGKFYLKDISESGFAFEVDDAQGFFLNDLKECRFFINPGLSLVLKFRVAYIFQKEKGAPAKIGAEIAKTSESSRKAYIAFIHLLDQLSQVSDIYHQELL